MDVEQLVEMLGADFYTGVPDSQLSALCDYLMAHKGIGSAHIIAANEGNAVALAVGRYLATGKIPVIYMQNSGIGNAINPMLSLINEKVYGIPCIFIVGWRGEPGVHDEPQHIRQGELTLRLLEDVGIHTVVVDKNISANELRQAFADGRKRLEQGRSIAFVIKKGALQNNVRVRYSNSYTLLRERVIECITEIADEDLLVATTGKAGRELFEIRERRQQSHKYDFLTVGSMGHGSSIALGLAMEKPEVKVWCIDGDGAALMHMGAMAVIGNRKPKNLVHVMINNEAHESVGGMPTVAGTVNFPQIALACGYDSAERVSGMEDLREKLLYAKCMQQLSMIEVKCAVGARDDLGRPTTTPKENKDSFMSYIQDIG